jgi:cytochrome c oxidase subunit 3
MSAAEASAPQEAAQPGGPLAGERAPIDGHGHHDDEGSKIGMWLFLFTELLLFGGLFLLFASYRSRYPAEFHHGSAELNTRIGVLNTFVLLTSSLTVALSIAAIQRGERALTMAMLSATLLLGAVFLVDKYIEWHGEILGHGIYPSSPALLGRPPGQIIFFGLYFTMTGLHGLHVIAGLVALTILLWMVSVGRQSARRFAALENGGLYWHLVDIIWILLLPLFYLIG